MKQWIRVHFVPLIKPEKGILNRAKAFAAIFQKPELVRQIGPHEHQVEPAHQQPVDHEYYKMY